MTVNYDEIIQSGIDNGAAPGAVATVVNRDGVIWEGAAGERLAGSGTAMTTDTVGVIYSMTKPITGVAAMQLVERGELALDAPASNVIPWLGEVQVLDGFDNEGNAKLRPPQSPVTLRHLLTHTAGFTYEIWNANEAKWREMHNWPGFHTLENKALQTPIAFDPGTQWEYGIGIDWAGKMIEAVSGMTLGEYVALNITGPLGMVDTAFAHTPAMLERAASVHARMPDGSFAPIDSPPPDNPEFEAGGGGMRGTMGDYGRFIRMILNNGELEGSRVLAEETVQMMCQNHIGDLRVKELTSVLPQFSNNAEFFPGSPKSWGLSFQINEASEDTGRPAGTLMWAGLANSFFWIDRKNGIGGAYLSQILPFADEKSMQLFFDIERATYQSIG